MSAAKHTPGPWQYEKMADPNRPTSFTIYGPTGRLAVVDTGFAGVPGKDEADANGTLIAAAPDLLAACKIALLAFDTMIKFEESRQFCDPGQMVMLRAAIAKAEGRE